MFHKGGRQKPRANNINIQVQKTIANKFPPEITCTVSSPEHDQGEEREHKVCPTKKNCSYPDDSLCQQLAHEHSPEGGET